MSEGDAGIEAAAETGADGAVQRRAPLSGGRKQSGEWERGNQERVEEGRRVREKCGGERGGNGEKKGTGAIRQEQGEPKAHREHSGAAVGIRETKEVGEGRTDQFW